MTENFQRRAVRLKLAELLREPLERLANDTRLRKLGRYDVGVAQELLRVFGLELNEAQLRSLERVKDLLEAVESAPRGRAATHRASPEAPLPPAEAVAAEATAAAPPPPPPPGTYECAALYSAARSGALVVHCSDGRLGEQIDEFLQESLALPRADHVACPGGPVALAGRLLSFWECRSVEEQLRFLVSAHALRQVVLVAHQDCTYYRERLALTAAQVEPEQLRDLEIAAACLLRMSPELAVRSYFARRVGERVRFEPRSEAARR